MIPSFNLVDQPWIPCLHRDGKVIDLSLRDLFARAHELVDISADSPMENVALYRFLLTILHRNFGPANSGQWCKLWEGETLPLDTLNAYLDEWYERFDLFSAEYPFGQFSEDNRVMEKSVVSLKHGFGMLPSSWFDHQVANSTFEVRLTPAEAARDLLTVLSFGFGGLSGIPGVSHTDAFCAKGVSFFIAGRDLKQTLLLNLNQYEFDPYADDPDLPTWEMDDSMELKRAEPFGLLDQYTFPSRSITLSLDPEKQERGELEVNRYRLGVGLRTKDVLDPMKHYYASKSSGLLPLSFDEDKQLWRNSYSLFELNPTGKRPPTIFVWLTTLIENGVLERDQLFHCKALGIAKNQGRADFSRQEQFPLPLSLLTDENKRTLLRDAISLVETTSWILRCNLALAGMHLLLDDANAYNWERYKIRHGAEKDLLKLKTTQDEIENWMKYTGVERHYWSALDVPFLTFMERLGEAEGEVELLPVKVWWQGQVRASAENAFKQILQYTNRTPRAFKAFAHGNNRLRGYLHKNLPLQEKTT